jgi:hypothetical protein
MTFYRGSLTKFLQFLGDRRWRKVTKQDVVAFRNSLITQVSAKTANHDLKALKMLFKSARRDNVVAEDPTEFVETVRRERAAKIKRPCTLPELRSVLDLASECSDKHAFEVSVASNGHRLLVAGIALVSAFQYHFQGCRLQNRAKPRLPPRRKAGREVRAPAPGVLRYNRAVLQLKFVWIVK